MLKQFFLLLSALILIGYNQHVFALQHLTANDIYKLPSIPPFQRLHYGSNPLEFGDLRLPSKQGLFPVVIIIHGGCWLSKFANLTIMDPLASAITKAGAATWNIEYPSVDQKGGGWPGTFQAVGKGIDYLRVIAQKYNLRSKSRCNIRAFCRWTTRSLGRCSS